MKLWHRAWDFLFAPGEPRRVVDERLVLNALAKLRVGYGADIWHLSRISSTRMYAALIRLEAKGVVVSDWEPDPVDRPRRRRYSIASEREMVE